MKKAYSYIRFSSQQQELGDSLRRQLALSEAYALRHNLELDSATYRDLGISAYDKSNLERGALAAFLTAVKSGAVAEGSYLLVENLDRLSRAQVHTALRLLTDLVEAGIVVVTLTDDKVWNRETIQDAMSLFLSVLIFYRAHDESKQKSKRLRAAWARKREQAYDGILPTSEVPRWLRVLPGRAGVEAVPEITQSIERAFELLKAGFGATAICRRANAESWPAPSTSGRWHPSLIVRLVHNRALLGEYQPHVRQEGRSTPIGDPVSLFPPIVSQELWDAVQLSQALRRKMPRRRDAQYKNVFQGLLLCGHCGASLVRKQKSATDRPSGYNKPGYTRYYCADRVLGLTQCPSCSAGMVEGALLTQIRTLAGGYLAQSDEAAKALAADVDRCQAAYEGYSEQLERLTDAVEFGDNKIPVLIARLNKVQSNQSAAKVNLEAAQQRLGALTLSEDDAESMESIAAVLTAENPRGRAELRERLIKLVARIWVWPEQDVAAVEWRATGDIVAVPLGLGCAGPMELLALQRPVRRSGRTKQTKSP